MRKFLLLAALAVLPAHATDEPGVMQGYVAGYDLLRNGKIEGHADVTLTAQKDGQWEMRNATRGTHGLPALVGFRIDERSLLQWHNGVPTTRGYEYTQRTAFKKRERVLSVDPAGGRIVSRDGKHEYVLEYRDDVLDRQSVSLALAGDIGRGASGLREYTVADRETIGPQRYRIGDHEHLSTDAGDFDAVRVERIRDHDNGRVTVTWFAATSQPFLVRLQQTEPDGDRIEMRLTSYRMQ